MPLTLVTGAPNSGKTGLAYAKIREAIRARRSCALLLPSWPDVDRASREFAPSAPVGLEIVQFDRFLQSRWLIEGDGRRMVGGVQRSALLRDCVRRQAHVLGPLAGSSGLPLLLERLVRAAAGRTCGARPEAPEAVALLAVVDEYREHLHECGLVEPGEAFVLLAEKPAPTHDVVVAHRFADLAPHQSAYLSALAAEGPEVLVTLTWTAGAPATEALSPLVAELAASGDHVIASGSHTSSQDLLHVSERLFRPPSSLLPVPADVGFCVASQMEDEVERAAREAEAAILRGVAPEQVAIVYRDPWPKLAALKRALADHGLVCDLDVERPLRTLPLARSTMHLLSYATSGSRGDLLAWLRSPFSGVDTLGVARLESRWRRAREERRERLRAAVKSSSRRAGESLRLAEALGGGLVDAAWATRFDELVAGQLMAAQTLDAVTPSDSLTADAMAARAMATLVADATEAAPSPLTVGDLLAAMSTMRVGPGRTERPGHVQVAGVERVRSRRFTVVVLGGLTADEFPRAEADDPVRSGAVGVAATALGIIRDEAAEARERADFYAVATRARERLVLLTHDLSGDDEPLAPSPFFSEVLELYAPHDPESGMPMFVERFSAPAGSRPSAARSLRERMGVCGSRGARSLAEKDVFSARELETYLACPTRWLHEHLLRPESPDAQIGPLEIGRLLHEILRDSLGRLAEEGSRVDPDTLQRAHEIANQAFVRACSRMPPPAGIVEADRLHSARRMIDAFLEREAVFAPSLRPVSFEYAFGFERDGDIPTDIGGLRVRGRIDRIDDGDGALLVTDYKSGSISSFSSFERLGLLQLQLYVLVLQAKGMPAAGAVYRSLRTGKVSGFHLADSFAEEELLGSTALTPEEFDAVLVGALRQAREAADGIRAAEFSPRPSRDACGYCGLSSVCGEAAA